MTSITYKPTVEELAAIQAAWSYAQIPAGRYDLLLKDLHLLDPPVEPASQRSFAYLLADCYARHGGDAIADRWSELLTYAKDENLTKFIHKVHLACDSAGKLPLINEADFVKWVSYYSRAFTHHTELVFDIPSSESSIQWQAVRIVTAQKCLEMKSSKRNFFYSLLANGSDYSETSETATKFLDAISTNPRHALFFFLSAVHPEISIYVDRDVTPANREAGVFDMSRADFSKPFLAWLQQHQPQAVTWLEELKQRARLCEDLQVPSKLSLPLLVTQPSVLEGTIDKYSVFRGFIADIGFNGNVPQPEYSVALPGKFIIE